MILVIDIGNTSTHLGLYRGGKIRRKCRVPTGLTTIKAIKSELRCFLKKSRVDAVGVSSVVPDVNRAWTKGVDAVTDAEPMFVNHQLDVGVAIDYPRPESIGADRLANACAAVSMLGAPVVVADFGTALTFDIVSRDAAYVGGVIAPGIPLMFEYLSDKTALLPRVEPRAVHSSIGKSTEEAMRIGGQIGYRGIVRELLLEIKKELGVRRLKVCSTGGYAALVVQDLDPKIPVIEDLTLIGIGKIVERNS